MQLFASAVLSMLSFAGLFVGSASSLPAKRQIISSVHGTLAAPNADAVIAPQETFPFSFETANLCESGYSPLSVWLLQQPPSDVSLTSSGEYAEGDYLYQFGDFLVANFGLPQMNTPPPSTLVMPNTSDLAQVPMVAEDGTTTVYFTVVETYSDCPGDVPAEFGVANNVVSYAITI
ncbi:hypothetical protein CERSUDRAFT_110029 [Gelatoporia subvermispora B]|uniref:Uncharacterized protein n=1 Tax=Ceriporiopsis subvermispora (strain B) TaxID=914234 RepID=M2PX91_CERS8|nr:hypothetical protein CERSUDRAFT_110029 [Gelatoporia subvermispora B]